MKTYFLLWLILISASLYGQKIRYDTPGAGNPLLPGYFADPTIRKFGDIYYLYTTTDGIKLASGEPQVWISEDFVNWYNYEIDIDLPDGLTNCWAPDVLEGTDGNYYYFMGNCQFGCNIYGYVSDSPMGPWRQVNEGKPVIPVGSGKKDLPALDAQFFRDEDGSLYSYFGTWCSTFGGIGWGKFSTDNNFILEKQGFIPMEQIPQAFEAAYMLKKDSIYFLMYSSGDCRLNSYAVHYAWSEHPEGPFVYGVNNPILASGDGGAIDGPGHHSILKEGDSYYIVYHRHNNPHSTGGEFRQVCVDKMTFADAYTILAISPGHKGVGYLGKESLPPANLAFQAKTSASSFYHLIAEKNRYSGKSVDHKFLPEYAVDDNNGTLWKASSGSLPQSLTIDLGKEIPIKRIVTGFEYPTLYYQYKIEVSSNGQDWNLFANRTGNSRSGSPMIDDNSLQARYVKLTVTGTEKAGMYAAVWNLKVYDKLFKVPPFQNKEVTEGPGADSSGSLLVDLNFKDEPSGKIRQDIKNQGSLQKGFSPVGSPLISEKEGAKALLLDGNSYLEFTGDPPESLNWNSAYTAAVWVYNPETSPGECLLYWNSRENMLQASYAALMYGKENYGAVAHGDGAVDIPFKELPSPGTWHHIAATFDGMLECVYVDGRLDTRIPMNLFVKTDKIRIGASGENAENFTGYIARAQLYDKCLPKEEIQALIEQTKPNGKKFLIRHNELNKK